MIYRWLLKAAGISLVVGGCSLWVAFVTRQAQACLYPWNFRGYHTFSGLLFVSEVFFFLLRMQQVEC